MDEIRLTDTQIVKFLANSQILLELYSILNTCEDTVAIGAKEERQIIEDKYRIKNILKKFR